jgi:hypothetical protein
MQDKYATAYGMAHSAILTEYFKMLLKQGTLIPKDAQAIFEAATKGLLALGTDITAAATEHVAQIRRGAGVDR